LRNLPTQEFVYNADGVTRSWTTYEYDTYNGANHAALAPRSNVFGFDASFTTSCTIRGNPTATTRHLLNASGVSIGSVSSYAQYDILGNVVRNVEANGNATDFDFTDRFGAPDAEGESNTAPTDLVGQSSYAFASKV